MELVIVRDNICIHSMPLVEIDLEKVLVFSLLVRSYVDDHFNISITGKRRQKLFNDNVEQLIEELQDKCNILKARGYKKIKFGIRV